MARLLTTLLFALAACSSGGGSEDGSGDDGSSEERRLTDPRTLVDTQAVETGSVGDFLVSTGTVESVAQADLVPEATGTVVAIEAEEGDIVRKGQVLAVIANATLDAAFTRAEAELARARADLSRVQQLQAQGVVSAKELADAEHVVKTAEASATEARRSQGHTRLISPIDGTVSARDLQYGEVAGGQRAFQVVDLDHLRVVIQLPERDLPRLQIGQRAELTPVYDPSLAVEATVERISPTVDPTSGTVRVTIALPEGDRSLRPGQFVSARVEVARHTEVAVVPRRALVYEDGAPLVYRVAVEEPPPKEEADEDGEDGKGAWSSSSGGGRKKTRRRAGMNFSFGGGDKHGEGEEEDIEPPGPYRIARKVPVELGFIDEDLAEISSGIALGDAIVVVGQASLRDGARVRFEGDPTVQDAWEAKQKEEAKEGEDGAKGEKGEKGENGAADAEGEE
ncbi:MAG: efflux RND transporter periplasmic adaptor subunit [Alphaproteobacteria bacterium]|nr:efflux RND transporter periplasmic adaptor subunit [Alphaproteobacteria bacterium]